MDRFYSARPDGVLTLEQFLRLVPRDYRNQIEDDIDKLIKSGWGEITFTLVHTCQWEIIRASDDSQQEV